ncbi:hypothetical protein [Pelagicoccus mobilis]|uniref:CR-type domain-containing protein n=1 Tax=Pelagicoccus mobilis TaxID=415221 RepID=A0A934VPC7_9BACT|nr:hypothetical protein [Pelagicoccus mobilis]MBK1875393.1 hypothetical protein [Pelagicoccus mobilis]
MPVPAKIRFTANIKIVYEESRSITPGTATKEHNQGELSWSLKKGFINWVTPQLEQSEFFTRHRYLEGSILELREKAPLRIKHKRCGSCSGSGKAKCQKCGGSGWIHCSGCGGKGTRTYNSPTARTQTTYSAAPNCPLCNGSGYVSRASSDGMGVTQVPCPGNHGTVQKAYTTTQWGSSTKTGSCSQCGGKGKSRCTSCSNGFVGSCKTCQGQKRITETFNLQQKAQIRVQVTAPKWLKRYKKLILQSAVKNKSLITGSARTGKHPKYNAVAEVDLELEPHGSPVDPWSIRDRRSGTVWTKPPSLWEKIIGWIGFPTKPPFSQTK